MHRFHTKPQPSFVMPDKMCTLPLVEKLPKFCYNHCRSTARRIMHVFRNQPSISAQASRRTDSGKARGAHECFASDHLKVGIRRFTYLKILLISTSRLYTQQPYKWFSSCTAAFFVISYSQKSLQRVDIAPLIVIRFFCNPLPASTRAHHRSTQPIEELTPASIASSRTQLLYQTPES